MRIIRFLSSDGRELLGEAHGDGSATVLLDAKGTLVPCETDALRRTLLRGKHAIVADDDDGMLRTIEATLAKFDCDCHLCHNGVEAVEAIESTEADFVVSDIVMPEADGYEVFAAARAKSKSIVLITGFGYDPGHVVVRASNDGCESILYKPFTPRQLVDAIAAAMVADQGSFVPCEERLRCEIRRTPIKPRQILCVGRNYPGSGVAADQPLDQLEVFMKPLGALLDPGEPIRLPDFPGVDPQVDAEGELAVVIGRDARNVSEADAMDYVLGFCPANDVTARHWQRDGSGQAWMRGKGFDTFCPVGPAIVTPDEFSDPNRITISTWINGQLVRRASSADMIWSVQRLISELSHRMTLPAGTLLLTGGPPRVNDEVPTFLSPGDTVQVDLDDIVRLSNVVVGSD